MNIEEYKNFISEKNIEELNMIKAELADDIVVLKKDIKQMKKAKFILKSKLLSKIFKKNVAIVNPFVKTKLEKKEKCLAIVNEKLSKLLKQFHSHNA